MAKVTDPLRSVEARGRVGGLVYNTWRGLHTVKTHINPAHQSDPLRQAHKLIVQQAGQRWRTLTDAQRTRWNHFANEHPDLDWSGHPMRLAGYHWYVRINTRLTDMGIALIDNPPTETSLCPPLILSAWILPGEFYIYWEVDPLVPHGTYRVDVWSTKRISAGRNPTLHDAYRRNIAEYEYGQWFDESLAPGWITFWLRPIRVNGITGQWASIRIHRY